MESGSWRLWRWGWWGRAEEWEVKVENFWGTAVDNMATGTEEDVMDFGKLFFVYNQPIQVQVK